MTMKRKEIPEFQDIEWLLVLVEITIYLNELNAHLQNREYLIPELYSHIKDTLLLWQIQLFDGNILSHSKTVHQVIIIFREKVLE